MNAARTDRGSAWFAVPVTGAAAVLTLPWVLIGRNDVGLPLCALASALILSVGIGRLLTRRRPLPTLTATVLGGASVAFLSHLGMGALWALLRLAGPSWERLEPGGFAGFVYVTLVFVGWITVPFGALAGFVAWVRRAGRARATRSPEAR